MDMERICNLNKCEDYRGFDIGYCNKLKTIMNSQEKKEFFALHCGESLNVESINNTWMEQSNPWDPES